MSDILRRLRDPNPDWKEDDIPDLLEDAAMEIERLREELEDSFETESKLATAQSGNRIMDAAIKRSGFVLTECDQCGLLVVHLEDGMPPLCVDCAKTCGA